MFHYGMFAQSIDPANALTAISAAREEVFFTNGPDFRVPTGLPFLIGALGQVNDASGSRAQVQSPSLRMLANLDVEPIVLAAVLGSPPEGSTWPQTPIPLVADEALNFAFLSDPVAAQLHYGHIILSDGPQQAVQGQLFTVRATATIAQNTVAWVNGNLTFNQSLPAGRYAVVGMRARSADAVAARLVFPEQMARPGVPVINAIADLDPWHFRFGRMGVFGEFPHTNPPTLDVIGGAAAAQTIMLDLIRTK